MCQNSDLQTSTITDYSGAKRHLAASLLLLSGLLILYTTDEIARLVNLMTKIKSKYDIKNMGYQKKI